MCELQKRDDLITRIIKEHKELVCLLGSWLERAYQIGRMIHEAEKDCRSRLALFELIRLRADEFGVKFAESTGYWYCNIVESWTAIQEAQKKKGEHVLSAAEVKLLVRKKPPRRIEQLVHDGWAESKGIFRKGAVTIKLVDGEWDVTPDSDEGKDEDDQAGGLFPDLESAKAYGETILNSAAAVAEKIANPQGQSLTWKKKDDNTWTAGDGWRIERPSGNVHELHYNHVQLGTYRSLTLAKEAAEEKFKSAEPGHWGKPPAEKPTRAAYGSITHNMASPNGPRGGDFSKPQTIKLFPGQEAVIEGPENTEPEEGDENLGIFEDNGWKEVVEKRGGGLLKYKKGRWTAIWMPAGEKWKLVTDTAVGQDEKVFERFFKIEQEVVDFANSMYGQVVPANRLVWKKNSTTSYTSGIYNIRKMLNYEGRKHEPWKLSWHHIGRGSSGVQWYASLEEAQAAAAQEYLGWSVPEPPAEEPTQAEAQDQFKTLFAELWAKGGRDGLLNAILDVMDEVGLHRLIAFAQKRLAPEPPAEDSGHLPTPADLEKPDAWHKFGKDKWVCRGGREYTILRHGNKSPYLYHLHCNAQAPSCLSSHGTLHEAMRAAQEHRQKKAQKPAEKPKLTWKASGLTTQSWIGDQTGPYYICYRPKRLKDKFYLYGVPGGPFRYPKEDFARAYAEEHYEGKHQPAEKPKTEPPADDPFKTLEHIAWKKDGEDLVWDGWRVTEIVGNKFKLSFEGNHVQTFDTLESAMAHAHEAEEEEEAFEKESAAELRKEFLGDDEPEDEAEDLTHPGFPTLTEDDLPKESLMDEARKLKKLQKEGNEGKGKTIPQLADEYGPARGDQRYIRNRFKLLRLAPAEQALVHEGKLTLEKANKIVDKRDMGKTVNGLDTAAVAALKEMPKEG